MEEFFSLSSIAERSLRFLPTLLGGVLIFATSYILAHGIKSVTRRLLQSRIGDGARGFIGDAMFVLVIIIGLVVALSTIGVNTTALVAGLGLSGFVIAFSLQSIIANAASGFFILLSRIFEVGDTIHVAGFEGKVKTIQLKHTIIEREREQQREEVLIPNSIIFNSALVIKKAKK
jgi:small-conductance mechanosensitive channel